MLIRPEFRIALRLALRSHLITIAVWLNVILALITWMSAEFSGRQPATVALDVGLSFIRIALPVVAIILAQELFSKEFERKFFLTSLTYPKTRQQFLLGRLCAIYFLLISLLIALAILLGVEVSLIGREYAQATPVALGIPYAVTIGFFAIELFAIVAMSALLSIVASTPSFVLIGTLGFIVTARSFSAIISLLQQNSTLVQNTDQYQSSLSILSYLLPDFHLLDIRMVALYGKMTFLPINWGLHLASTLAYSLALIALSIWALNRKQFL